MSNETNHVSAALALTTIEHYILASVLRVARHGLGIFEEVAQQSNNSILLVPGTLYTAIKRLLGAGLIVMVDSPPGDRSAGAPRKFYQATEEGRQVMAARAEWLFSEAQRIRSDLGVTQQNRLHREYRATRNSHIMRPFLVQRAKSAISPMEDATDTTKDRISQHQANDDESPPSRGSPKYKR